nr:3-oxoacyl-[acyl-carrier-protein] synthase [Candidatus Cloacimonadota bacterium]
MGAKISRIEYYLPEHVLSNEDLIAQHPEWNSQKVEKKVGIRNRHIAGSEETALDMAVKAAQKLFNYVDPSLIDFVLFCTQSPDHLLPTSACIAQDRLGLRTNIGALDFNLGCSGYIYGLALAKSLIESGIAMNILLLTGETYSKYISDSDISNRSIFGDAATATLVTESDNYHIGDFVLGTDGKGAENLIVRNIGAKNSFRAVGDEYPELYMNGPEIFNFTIDTIPPLVEDVCKKNHLDKDQLDYVILHQANKYIIEFLISTIGLDPSKCHIDMLEYGNTVSNTIPIALKDSWDKGIIKVGDSVLLAGFGVGYSWGSTIIRV